MSSDEEFDCMDCGACCRCFPIFASAADAEREPRIRTEAHRLPRHLSRPDRAYQLHPLPFHESCAFLQADRLCAIYATRPGVCRRFEPGSPQCREARDRVYAS